MAEGVTSFERLQDIWSDWSIVQGEDATSAQKKAVDLLTTWLEVAEDDPQIAIRAVQVLLVDPTRPEGLKRPAVKEVIRSVSEAWTSAATGGTQSLFALQALLLASWPSSGNAELYEVAALLRSSFELPMKGRELQRGHLNQWFERIVSRPQSRFIKTPLNQGELNKAKSEAAAAAAASKATQDLPTVVTSQEKLNASVASLVTAITGLATVNDLVRQHELLFWGQAKYSHTLKKPFRNIPHNDQTWLAAWEAAERSTALNPEPAASFLVTVLSALGHQVDETNRLEHWLRLLHTTLRAEKVPSQPVSKELVSIAEGDALGLPVTFVRMAAARREDWDPASVAAAVALDLEATLDRGQWASWLLRELLLDMRFAE